MFSFKQNLKDPWKKSFRHGIEPMPFHQYKKANFSNLNVLKKNVLYDPVQLKYEICFSLFLFFKNSVIKPFFVSFNLHLNPIFSILYLHLENVFLLKAFKSSNIMYSGNIEVMYTLLFEYMILYLIFVWL